VPKKRGKTPAAGESFGTQRKIVRHERFYQFGLVHHPRSHHDVKFNHGLAAELEYEVFIFHRNNVLSPKSEPIRSLFLKEKVADPNAIFGNRHDDVVTLSQRPQIIIDREGYGSVPDSL
jgi:hypothetical protein